MKLAPKNWRDFQHYKDRAPPWIRLQRKLLDDRDFHRLPVESRALAPMLWLIASESMDGVFEGDSEELAFRLRSTEKEIQKALAPLLERGFFVMVQDASDVLAECPQVAVPETEAETEAETEQRAPAVLGERDASAPYRAPPCPHGEIVKAYAEALPSLPQVTVLNDARKRTLQARWREVCASESWAAEQGLEWFVWYFGHVAHSPFLMGRAPPTPGRQAFRADFDWLMAPTNFAKVVEGRYHGPRAA
jgi:hypothetical protein